jgi:hypothetical protein
MEAATSSLTPAQKAQLHEVADGLLAVYRTLVRMQYLEPSWIKEGPHDMAEFLPICEAEGLDTSIIYLYSILPYVDDSDCRGLDFFQGGCFLDLRDKDTIEYARDPFYSSNEKETMRPWMTPLSGLGNHRTVILYDAKRHVIGMFDQESGGSTDPNVGDGAVSVGDDEDMGDWESDDGEGNDDNDSDDDAADEENDSDNGDDDEGADDDDNENIYDEMDARPAPDVLRDMVRWFEDLTEHPGDGDDSGREWYPEVSLPLYRKHGWPSLDFDGDAFRIDQVRAAAAETAKYFADEPLRKVEELQRRVDEGKGETHLMRQARKAISKAKNADDEWLARWNLWLEEHHYQNAVLELADAKAKAERLCPGGVSQKPDELPLWELRQLKADATGLALHVETLQKQVDDASGPDAAPEPLRVRLEYAIKRVAVSQRAIEACEADAGGRSFPNSRGVTELGIDLDEMFEMHAQTLKESERAAQAIREWLDAAPGEAIKAKEKAKDLLRQHESVISSSKEGLEKCRPPAV